VSEFLRNTLNIWDNSALIYCIWRRTTGHESVSETYSSWSLSALQVKNTHIT
jgi:hypothetical protein